MPEEFLKTKSEYISEPGFGMRSFRLSDFGLPSALGFRHSSSIDWLPLETLTNQNDFFRSLGFLLS